MGLELTAGHIDVMLMSQGADVFRAGVPQVRP